MAGVVRRDGLREAVTALRDEWTATYTRIIEADWNEEEQPVEDDPGLLPDVPPDPPAADVPEVLGWHRPLNAPEFVKFRDEQLKDLEVRAAYERARLRNQMAVVIHATRKPKCECSDFAAKDEDIADALLSSGVLVDAADVRARAQQEIYDRAAYWSDKFGKEVPVGCIYLDTTPPTEDDIAWAQEVAERLGLTDRDAR